MTDTYGGRVVSARFNAGNLEFYDASNGNVLFTFPTAIPAFTIVKGHAAGFAKVTVKLAANTLFFAYVQMAISEGSPWGTLINNVSSTPGIALAGKADSNAVTANNVSGGRGTVVGNDFAFGVIVPGIVSETPPKAASGWFVADANGFFDVEIQDSNKGTCYLTIIIPGSGTMAQSRQIVSADYA